MSKEHQAELILKLYDLRREEKMRQAREWFQRDFNPETAADVAAVMFSDKSAYLRMVTSYWDMACALVNHGAIDMAMFADTTGEHMFVYAKLEPMVGELRQQFGPQYLANIEKLIDATQGGRERLAMFQERIKWYRAEMAKKAAAAQGQG